MKIGNLTLFGGKPSHGSVSLAWWHSPHSLTWRWSLTLSWRKSWKTGFFGGKHNCGGTWILALPVVAFQFSTQHPMWYRDLHRADNERRDHESYERYLERSRMAEARAKVSSIHRDHETLQ